ncbi:MAG: 1,4-dihydroxy-2-naphthoate octaprenyltransferase [Desulfobacterales bacterium]|nr:1,4-dihydroxy-2-naphthoate octaprenyltransferase [Deltaproteobacteria bacterium]NNL41879.1 1,4-dihydroxy-2-naphthoate octaprenyltransferase [Desulfobacterales bacterium]NNL75408.1 1,4-dihydroxy-2-naphthoate octaprenyltransferase [Desulfobacterales bacterium]
MSIYRNWFLASRPWSFSMTTISVSVGGALAAIYGPFSWSLFLLTLVGTILLHAATNLINDYYDVKSGVDTPEVATAQYRPHPLVEGKLEARHVRTATYILYALSTLIGIFLVATRGWELLWIGLIGTFASLTYTAPPLKYKYSALGEISVFLMWGPLMVAGSFFVQRQEFSLNAFWISLPFGVLVALVLLANNIRDITHDNNKNILTLAIVLGQRKSILLYGTLVVLAYLGIILMSIFGPLYLWSLIVLASLPLALRLLKQMKAHVPDDADARTAQLDTAFGVLLVISLVLAGVF